MSDIKCKSLYAMTDEELIGTYAEFLEMFGSAMLDGDIVKIKSYFKDLQGTARVIAIRKIVKEVV